MNGTVHMSCMANALGFRLGKLRWRSANEHIVHTFGHRLGSVVGVTALTVETQESVTGIAVGQSGVVVGFALLPDLVFGVDEVVIGILSGVFEAVDTHLLVADPMQTLEVTATQGARDAVLLPVRALGVTLVVVTLEWAVRRLEHCIQSRFTRGTSGLHGNGTSSR